MPNFYNMQALAPFDRYNKSMACFESEYKHLNPSQKKAVDSIEGPVLVIAGPGTGKTQLLSLRVANIIRLTDTSPRNILCLTFTDNAARNMRERLESIIGQAAYHVNIHTFHSFGSDVIGQYPDYFLQNQLLQQIDELGKYQIMRELFDKLPHDNPLSAKVGDEYIFLKDVSTMIGWFKQNALKPSELHEIITQNQSFFEEHNELVATTFKQTPSPKLLPLYQNLLTRLKQTDSSSVMHGFPHYASQCTKELELAIESTSTGRFAPKITEWRNKWCQKNKDGEHAFRDGGNNIRKLHAVATIYQHFMEAMRKRGLYDFDDMVVESVHAMEQFEELRADLQERYMYILVDEFQDTNKAQLRMLKALGDNSANVGNPNILAVGDDDQAIYAFQGAEVSNMMAFLQLYPDASLITLRDNYRSTRDILTAGELVAQQITDRLTTTLSNIEKHLTPHAHHSQTALKHTVLSSELAQYQWIATSVEKYIKAGVAPQHIAILAPRHKSLERLIPYLDNHHIPISYERRENLLESPIIQQLVRMVELLDAIARNDYGFADEALSEVLSYEFWGIPNNKLVELSMHCYNAGKHWLDIILNHQDSTFSDIAQWLVTLARKSTTEPLEYMLDALFGIDTDSSRDSSLDESYKAKKRKTFISPMKEYYFSETNYTKHTDHYLALLGQLSTLRHKLRQWQPDRTLYAKDLVAFAQLHREAHIKIIDTNPHTQSTNAVQVMTAYKAKGLEFDIVFVINAQDEVWGPTARSNHQKISLPQNVPIAPTGSSDNDKLRLFFVALTRAKHTLHITSYTHTLENKLSPPLSFIVEDDATAVSREIFKAHNISTVPSIQAVEILSTDWSYRFRQIIADKPTLFEPILANYRLSITHLNNYIDVVNTGPQYFFIHHLLRFPTALTPPAAYGDAIHKTLEWIHVTLRTTGQLPPTKKIHEYFVNILSRKHLRHTDLQRLTTRGKSTLSLYMANRKDEFIASDLVERGFNNEGVIVGQAHLSGKIDKIRFLSPNEVGVIDFKTGKPASSWQGRDEYEKIKLHLYRQQLMFYKLLVEGSASYNVKLRVRHGALEFVEANDAGKLIENLEAELSTDDLLRFTKLIGVVWEHIQSLSFPDITQYPKTLKGITAFEQDLLDGKI